MADAWRDPIGTSQDSEAIQHKRGSVGTSRKHANAKFRFIQQSGGDFGGADNQAYHPAAQLVEKFRIVTNKAKSKKRLALEVEVANGLAKRN